ncbi:MAG: LacI family transcriptional regulator [Candidatus Omnitrophica bacterium]|nr:LacI family transcriptional regulator [Candidatus Omnitrophota bacterium]
MKKITILDVAKAASVSTTTVSRVINKFPSVTSRNRLKVEETIRKLKYRPNTSAQRLAGGRANTISLAIPRYSGLFHSFYAIEIIRSIGTICERMKLDLLLHLGGKRAFPNLGSVDGIIFADVIGNENQVDEVLDQGIPSVVINKRIDSKNVNCIYIDNRAGAREAVNYLISLGHKSIVHISGDLHTQAAQERLKGYKKALTDNRIQVNEKYIFKADYSRNSARAASEKIIKMHNKPTAIFVASDDMAMEVVSCLSEKGIKVPSDISIIGFDDDPVGLFGPIRLTTVRQPLTEMCEKALETLLYIISGKPKTIKSSVLKTELVIRDSVVPFV